MVLFWDCLRITLSKIPEGFEVKLGHLQKLYQELAEHEDQLLKRASCRPGTQCTVDTGCHRLNSHCLVWIDV